mgnify:CR=1 FL=1
MVRIGLDNKTKEIEIRIPVFYLYEVIDNDDWLSAVLLRAKMIVIEEFEKAGLNDDEGSEKERTPT